MKCMWAVLCERISTDKETNLVSYLTCVEGVEVAGLPVSLKNISFGSTWLKETSDSEILNVRFTLVKPDGSQRAAINSGSFEVKGDNHRLNVVLDGMPIEETGFYTFRLEMEKDASWIEVANIPFRVKLISKAQPLVEQSAS